MPDQIILTGEQASAIYDLLCTFNDPDEYPEATIRDRERYEIGAALTDLLNAGACGDRYC